MATSLKGIKMRVVSQTIWKDSQLSRDLRKGWEMKVPKIKSEWFSKARFSIKEVLLAGVLIYAVHFISLHIQLGWK